MPGAKPPAPQPLSKPKLSKPRHNKAAQAAWAFMKPSHRFDPGNLTISDEGLKFINIVNGFGRNCQSKIGAIP